MPIRFYKKILFRLPWKRRLVPFLPLAPWSMHSILWKAIPKVISLLFDPTTSFINDYLRFTLPADHQTRLCWSHQHCCIWQRWGSSCQVCCLLCEGHWWSTYHLRNWWWWRDRSFKCWAVWRMIWCLKIKSFSGTFVRQILFSYYFSFLFGAFIW